jgi:hypothetical protein
MRLQSEVRAPWISKDGKAYTDRGELQPEDSLNVPVAIQNDAKNKMVAFSQATYESYSMKDPTGIALDESLYLTKITFRGTGVYQVSWFALQNWVTNPNVMGFYGPLHLFERTWVRLTLHGIGPNWERFWAWQQALYNARHPELATAAAALRDSLKLPEFVGREKSPASNEKTKVPTGLIRNGRADYLQSGLGFWARAFYAYDLNMDLSQLDVRVAYFDAMGAEILHGEANCCCRVETATLEIFLAIKPRSGRTVNLQSKRGNKVLIHEVSDDRIKARIEAVYRGEQLFTETWHIVNTDSKSVELRRSD